MTNNTATRHAVTFLELATLTASKANRDLKYYCALAFEYGLSIERIAEVTHLPIEEVKAIVHGQN